MKKLFLLFLLCSSTVCVAQKSAVNVRDVFKTMPDSLTPYLSMNNRLDMLDFMDAKMKAVVTNSLGGSTEMVFLSDDSLAIKMNEASLLSMKVSQVDTATIVSLHRTYYTKRNQYETVSQTFNSYWFPLSKPVVASTLLRRDDDVRNLPHF